MQATERMLAIGRVSLPAQRLPDQKAQLKVPHLSVILHKLCGWALVVLFAAVGCRIACWLPLNTLALGRHMLLSSSPSMLHSQRAIQVHVDQLLPGCFGHVWITQPSGTRTPHASQSSNMLVWPTACLVVCCVAYMAA